MKILGMGLPELIIILVVILLIFGPKNLPKLGAAFGKTMKNLKEGLGVKDKGAEAPAEEAVEVVEAASEIAPEPAAVEPVATEPEPAPAAQEAPKRVVKTVVKKSE